MKEQETIRVWDPFVRIFHWSVAALFVASYLTGEEEHPLHVWSGYAILTLIALRLCWGLVGSRYARFSGFSWSLSGAIDYLKQLPRGTARRTLGHNPAGSIMVVMLLTSLLATGGSGMLLYGSEGHGPLAGLFSAGAAETLPANQVEARAMHEEDDHEASSGHHDEGEEWLEEIHETFVNITLLLVLLHIAGVLASSLAHRENLVRAMITGRKTAE